MSKKQANIKRVMPDAQLIVLALKDYRTKVEDSADHPLFDKQAALAQIDYVIAQKSVSRTAKSATK